MAPPPPSRLLRRNARRNSDYQPSPDLLSLDHSACAHDAPPPDGVDGDYGGNAIARQDADVCSTSQVCPSDGEKEPTPNGDDWWETSARGRRRITDWRARKVLGSGSHGIVYKAVTGDGFRFAVKEITLAGPSVGSPAKSFSELEQEILLFSSLEHENIVQFYGAKREGTKLYIYQELVPHGSLQSLYEKHHLRRSQVASYTRQILGGLSYLHQRNVLHRDIKCSNILLGANGTVKLADFGLAKEMITNLAKKPSCKGSVYWMAPEVALQRPYGAAADIWSLGCTVLEMITGDLPYPGEEAITAFYKIGKGEGPAIPSSVAGDARDFIGRCLRINPAERPSAKELLQHHFVSDQRRRDHQHYLVDWAGGTSNFLCCFP